MILAHLQLNAAEVENCHILFSKYSVRNYAWLALPAAMSAITTITTNAAADALDLTFYLLLTQPFLR